MGNVIVCDVCVIGGGPAGMKSAIELAAAGAKTVIVEKSIFGGQANFAAIYNRKPARTAMQEMANAAKRVGATMLQGTAGLITYNHGLFIIYLNASYSIQAKSIILALGRSVSNLTSEFYGEGKQTALVCGNGMVSCEKALDRAATYDRVYMCYSGVELDCSTALKKKISAKKNILQLPNCSISKIEEANATVKVSLSTLEEITVDRLDLEPQFQQRNELAKGFVQFAEDGSITPKIPGVFTAGDCMTGSKYTIEDARASGEESAKNAISYLRSLNYRV